MEFGQTQGNVIEEIKIDVPPQCKVILLNDDYTTKEFVVYILQKVFHKTTSQSVEIMETVHKTGKGIAGIYTYDIAKTLARMAMDMARREGFPLKCDIENI